MVLLCLDNVKQGYGHLVACFEMHLDVIEGFIVTDSMSIVIKPEEKNGLWIVFYKFCCIDLTFGLI